MPKYNDDLLNKPVDVIDNGTRRRFDTRREAIACYLGAMIGTEGSAKERYSTIYVGLQYGKESVVSDGEPEFVSFKGTAGSAFRGSAELVRMIENGEIGVASRELWDASHTRLVIEDRSVIKALLAKEGCYAAQLLRNYVEHDEELVMVAALSEREDGTRREGDVLRFAGARLQGNKDFVLKILEVSPYNIFSVAPQLYNDIDVMSCAHRAAGKDAFLLSAVKDCISDKLFEEMLEARAEKQSDKTITAKIDFNSLSEEQMEEYGVRVFDTDEAMFNDLYLFDADYETLRDAIYVLKHNDMHSAVVSHLDVRYDGQKYYYSPDMEELERVVLDGQKGNLADKIAEARELGDRATVGEISKMREKDMDKDR